MNETDQMNGGEATVRMLEAHGVDHVFGLCGDTSLPFYDALARLDHGITHILTRDERHAAYMADCYARVSGKVGVCEGPSGGGATYILPGVVEANESSIPILAITTDIAVSSRGKYTLTEMDQEGLFRPITKWNKVIDRADELPGVFRTAFRNMTSGRPGAAHIGLPFDVQRDPVARSQVYGDAALGVFPSRRIGADPDSIRAAADALLSAREPMFVCGGGPVIAGAEAELAAIAELLEAPVASTVSGHGVIADDHPLAVGVVGSNGGTLPTRELLMTADLVCFIGCRAGSVTTERWRYPAPGKTRIIHIDADPAVLGAIYPTEVAVLGDAKLALGALLVELQARVGKAPQRQRGRAAVAAARKAKFAAFDELSGSAEQPIRPERVVATLNRVLGDDAVIVCDPGTPCPYFSAYYRFNRPGRQFISNRAHGALGYSIAGSIGAQYGRPRAKVVSVMGDGSFGFACGEFETVVRKKLPITFVVFSNDCYGWIKAGQKAGHDGRYFSVDFNRTDHARVAEAFGLKAWTVEDPANLEAIMKKAVEDGGPTLVNVISQPLHEARAPVSEWVA
jgi:acetolactate synthase I/II/III large subunit